MKRKEFLAMSLPFDLFVIWRDGERVLLEPKNIRFIFDNDGDVKPILYPLSDLTKEIEHSGERFNPLHLLSNYSKEQIGGGISGLEWGIVSSFPFLDILRLTKLHFDITGLIEKGEAIDVNTLEINPYK